MSAPLFVPVPGAWSARPADPSDVFFAQRVAEAPGAARVGLFGIPFDAAVIGRKGTAGGPDAIRADLQKLKPWTLAAGEVAAPIADWGNVRLPAGSIADAHAAVEVAARTVLGAGQFPLALGGDHSLTFPLVKPHAENGRIGVINLDAHLDLRDVVNGQLNSGQSFGRLLDGGLVRGENLVEVGIRDFANSPRYAEKARKAGATVIGADEWREAGLAAIERAVAIASDGTDGVYLSLDVDVLDQAHAPGVSAPTPGGIDTTELYSALRRIASRARLVGADVVELAPNLDEGGRTARATAYAAAHLLAGLSARRG